VVKKILLEKEKRNVRNFIKEGRIPGKGGSG